MGACRCRYRFRWRPHLSRLRRRHSLHKKIYCHLDNSLRRQCHVVSPSSAMPVRDSGPTQRTARSACTRADATTTGRSAAPAWARVQTREWSGGRTAEQKFYGAASEPLAILKFDSVATVPSATSGQNRICFRHSCCRGAAKSGCPLYPRKRTLGLSRGMSALCHKRTFNQARE